MQTIVTARHCEISELLQERAGTIADRVSALAMRPISCTVVFDVEGTRSLAELRLLDARGDTLVSRGANTLGDIGFSIADPAPLLEQARTKAIADARQKAQVYAAAAGVKLGRVIFIRDTTPGLPRPMSARMMSSAAVPIAPGEQELEVSVSVTYALE